MSHKAPLGFGTFKGVFIPSVVTIFGVIMYLRLGWVVGNVGLFGALLIITLATAITFLTGLSIAATATNMKIGGGGAYYMISRSFGVEMGAAIGVPLYLAQATGIAFYVAGFAESARWLLPQLSLGALGSLSLLILALLAYRSPNLALKAQVLIFALILASLLSFFAGQASSPLPQMDEVPPVLPFWAVFAIFFPAVTGIETGISMSGDLRKPGRSLPLGTLSAVVLGFLVYVALAAVLSNRGTAEVLRSHLMIMRDTAALPALILAGIWGATLSSALGALLGAPRTLQALAKDKVVFRFLGKGHGEMQVPRVATVVTLVIALAGVILGDINAIAPVLTMFFLTSYGFLNLAAALEGFMGNPSWRPSFRTPWFLSLLGAGACLAAMLMINAGATFVATFCVVGVFLLTKQRKLGTRWSDMRRGMLMALARYSIYRLDETQADPRSWRPNILVLGGSPTSRWYLVQLADAITHGKSLLTVAAVIAQDHAQSERVATVRSSIKEYLRKRHVPALVQVQIAPDPLPALERLVQSYGLGPLTPNTVLLGDTENQAKFAEYVQLLRRIYSLKRNVVVVRQPSLPNDTTESGLRRRIDVWWGRQRQNANLSLALAYMLQTSPEWKGAELVLKTTIQEEEEREAAEESLKKFVAEGRLPVQVEVHFAPDKESIFHTIREKSRDADLVFLGMRPPEKDETAEAYTEYYRRLLLRTQDHPLTAMVMASEEVKFGDIFA